MKRFSKGLIAVAALTLPLAGTSAVAATAVADPLDRPSLAIRAPARSYFLALVEIGGGQPRLVAAGERGVIVFSDDLGKSWRQAQVPTSVTLTALAFPTPKEGWAVGHGGVVLHTADGGETWSTQLDGNRVARIIDAAARAGSDESLQRRATQFLTDGPDKPFLAVHFSDALHGFIVGAYGLILGTDDGGKTWQSWLGRVNNRGGRHLNAIAVAGDLIYLAGEQGLFLRSMDRGNSFEKIETPYQGSFFTALADGDTVLLGGLKGNLFRSEDRGEHFEKLAGMPPANVLSSGETASGAFYFVSQSGQLLISRDRGRSLQAIPLPAGSPPAVAAIHHADGSWSVAGQRGVGHISSNK